FVLRRALSWRQRAATRHPLQRRGCRVTAVQPLTHTKYTSQPGCPYGDGPYPLLVPKTGGLPAISCYCLDPATPLSCLPNLLPSVPRTCSLNVSTSFLNRVILLTFTTFPGNEC
uniref:Uncharacterized protein n=1 Tax=Chrysemys picta bellii TaxID=8478 RepID=A0A8C3HPF1_CHRPI